MAKIRCSNCEKSVKIRHENGIILNTTNCKATGEFICSGTRGGNPDDPYYQPRECEEFLSRIEYSQQFRVAVDKIIKNLARGNEIKGFVRNKK